MQGYQSLRHAKWNCKSHAVFIPKKLNRLNFGAIRKHLGDLLHELAGQKECEIFLVLDERPCSHVYQYFTEVFGGERSGF
jgi:putative transposase